MPWDSKANFISITRTRFAVSAFVFVIVVFTQLVANRVSADQWFDQYGAIAWKEEIAHLANFAIFLNRNTKTVGYIAICRGGESKASLRKRVKKMTTLLTQELKVQAESIKVSISEGCGESNTILEPWPSEVPQPRFY